MGLKKQTVDPICDPIRCGYGGYNLSEAPSDPSLWTDSHASPRQRSKPCALWGRIREGKVMQISHVGRNTLHTPKGLHIPVQKQLLLIKAFRFSVLCCFDRKRTIHHFE